MNTKKQNWEKGLKIAELLLPIYNRQLSSGYPTACIDKFKWALEDDKPFEWVVGDNSMLPVAVATAVACAGSVTEAYDSLHTAVNFEAATNTEQEDCLLISTKKSLDAIDDYINEITPDNDPNDDSLVNILLMNGALLAAEGNDPFLAAALIYAITVYMPLREQPSLTGVVIPILNAAVFLDSIINNSRTLEITWNNDDVIKQLKQLV